MIKNMSKDDFLHLCIYRKVYFARKINWGISKKSYYRTEIQKSYYPPYFDLKYFSNSGWDFTSGLISGILLIGQKHILKGAKTILLGPILFSSRSKSIFK